MVLAWEPAVAQLGPRDQIRMESALARGTRPVSKPDDPDLTHLLEEIGTFIWQSNRKERYFTFVFNNADWDQHPATGGGIKTEITQSRRLHPREWKQAKAVVLSYRGKKNYSLDVLVGTTGKTFRLSVDIKTGSIKWQSLSTKQANALREAYEVAHR